MLHPFLFRQHLRSLLGTIALAGLAHTAFAVQSTLLESATDMTKTVTKNTTEALSTLIDRLPDLLDIGLPSFAPRDPCVCIRILDSAICCTIPIFDCPSA